MKLYNKLGSIMCLDFVYCFLFYLEPFDPYFIWNTLAFSACNAGWINLLHVSTWQTSIRWDSLPPVLKNGECISAKGYYL